MKGHNTVQAEDTMIGNVAFVADRQACFEEQQLSRQLILQSM